MMRVAAVVALLLAWSCRTGALQCGAVEPSTSYGGVYYYDPYGDLEDPSELNDPVIDMSERDEPAAPLADEDFQLGRTVDAVYKTGEQPLRADQFEGDIVGIDPGAFEGSVADYGQWPPFSHHDHHLRVRRFSPVADPFKLWDGGRVPYTISLRYTACGRAFIARAMEELSEKTCVEFVPRADERVYIHVTPLDGCWSYVGRHYNVNNPGAEVKQIVSIGEGCVYKGIILHELMHTLGFFHEHSRRDRDDHIRVMDRNIDPTSIANFYTYNFANLTHSGTPYDLNSIMHYGRFAFAKSDKPTILTQERKNKDLIGQRKQLSAIDVDRVKKLYQCDVPPNCRDQSHWCPHWEANDQCKTHEHMRAYCSRSCGDCKSSGDGGNDGVNDGHSAGGGDGDSIGDSAGGGDGDSIGDSAGGGDGDSIGDSAGGGDGDIIGDSAGGGDGDSIGDSAGGGDGDGIGDSAGGGDGDSIGDSAGGGDGDSIGDSAGGGDGDSIGDSAGGGDGDSIGDSAGGGDGDSIGDSAGGGDGDSIGDSAGGGDGDSIGDSAGGGDGDSIGDSAGGGDGDSIGDSAGGGDGDSIGDSAGSGDGAGDGDSASGGGDDESGSPFNSDDSGGDGGDGGDGTSFYGGFFYT